MVGENNLNGGQRMIKETAAFITGRTIDEDAVSHTILQLLALQG